MDTSEHPDPFQDVMHHGLQRAVQVASCAVTAGQVYLYQHRTQARAVSERDERGRRALNAQIRAERDAARAGWAPALDPGWLRQASLLQTAETWSAAAPFADRAVPWYEPAAATALRKCEERLRELHPYAMARYDRLRADGMSPSDAMRQAAPLFARPSRAYDAPTTSRPALSAGNGHSPWAAGVADSSPGDGGTLGNDGVLERRGRQILGAIQDRAREQGRDPLGEAEQRTVLETVTSLPPEVIDRIVQPDTTTGLVRTLQDRAAGVDRARAADLDAATDRVATPGADERTHGLTSARDDAATADAARGRAARTARPWEHDFPTPIRDVVAAAASGVRTGTRSPAPSRVPVLGPGRRARRQT